MRVPIEPCCIATWTRPAYFVCIHKLAVVIPTRLGISMSGIICTTFNVCSAPVIFITSLDWAMLCTASYSAKAFWTDLVVWSFNILLESCFYVISVFPVVSIWIACWVREASSIKMALADGVWVLHQCIMGRTCVICSAPEVAFIILICSIRSSAFYAALTAFEVADWWVGCIFVTVLICSQTQSWLLNWHWLAGSVIYEDTS